MGIPWIRKSSQCAQESPKLQDWTMSDGFCQLQVGQRETVYYRQLFQALKTQKTGLKVSLAKIIS